MTEHDQEPDPEPEEVRKFLERRKARTGSFAHKALWLDESDAEDDSDEED